MSCGPHGPTRRATPAALLPSLADEGFRLFFPLGALYAALWPAVWVLALGFDLPLARDMPPGLWHAHEMIVGAFGAALIGFLTTAAPEWTDTAPLRGRPLWALAALWAVGRLVGAPGWEALGLLGALADLGWLAALLGYLLWLSWRRRTDRLLAFAVWLALLAGCVGAARVGFLTGEIALARAGLELAGLAFLGLLGFALARITVPVTNLILDPSEETAPFRPHPGRMNLAPGLVLVAMAGEAAGLSPAVSGFLICAAGAAFLDRVGEHFIGRSALRAEMLMLAGAAAFAGAGLLMTGAARLGAPWPAVTGLHLAFMGGLGLATYAVFCIAGRLHAGRPLGLGRAVRAGALTLAGATALRIAPDLGVAVPGPLHGLASLAWGGAFLVWLAAYWPALRHVAPAAAPAPMVGPREDPPDAERAPQSAEATAAE